MKQANAVAFRSPGCSHVDTHHAAAFRRQYHEKSRLAAALEDEDQSQPRHRSYRDLGTVGLVTGVVAILQ